MVTTPPVFVKRTGLRSGTAAGPDDREDLGDGAGALGGADPVEPRARGRGQGVPGNGNLEPGNQNLRRGPLMDEEDDGEWHEAREPGTQQDEGPVAPRTIEWLDGPGGSGPRHANTGTVPAGTGSRAPGGQGAGAQGAGRSQSQEDLSSPDLFPPPPQFASTPSSGFWDKRQSSSVGTRRVRIGGIEYSVPSAVASELQKMQREMADLKKVTRNAVQEAERYRMENAIILDRLDALKSWRRNSLDGSDGRRPPTTVTWGGRTIGNAVGGPPVSVGVSAVGVRPVSSVGPTQAAAPSLPVWEPRSATEGTATPEPGRGSGVLGSAGAVAQRLGKCEFAVNSGPTTSVRKKDTSGEQRVRIGGVVYTLPGSVAAWWRGKPAQAAGSEQWEDSVALEMELAILRHRVDALGIWSRGSQKGGKGTMPATTTVTLGAKANGGLAQAAAPSFLSHSFSAPGVYSDVVPKASVTEVRSEQERPWARRLDGEEKNTDDLRVRFAELQRKYQFLTPEKGRTGDDNSGKVPVVDCQFSEILAINPECDTPDFDSPGSDGNQPDSDAEPAEANAHAPESPGSDEEPGEPRSHVPNLLELDTDETEYRAKNLRSSDAQPAEARTHVQDSNGSDAEPPSAKSHVPNPTDLDAEPREHMAHGPNPSVPDSVTSEPHKIENDRRRLLESSTVEPTKAEDHVQKSDRSDEEPGTPMVHVPSVPAIDGENREWSDKDRVHPEFNGRVDTSGEHHRPPKAARMFDNLSRWSANKGDKHPSMRSRGDEGGKIRLDPRSVLPPDKRKQPKKRRPPRIGEKFEMEDLPVPCRPNQFCNGVADPGKKTHPTKAPSPTSSLMMRFLDDTRSIKPPLLTIAIKTLGWTVAPLALRNNPMFDLCSV